MKTVLPWVLAIAALCGAYFFFSAGQKKSSELASFRAVIGEGDQVREENDGLKKIKAQVDEIARLKKDNEDVTKLRGEVQQLREDKQGLANQIQTAQETIDAAQSKAVAIAAASRPVQPKPVLEPASREEINAMKQVGLGLIMSANDHGGALPTGLAGWTDYLKGSTIDAKVLEQFVFFDMKEKLQEIKEPASTILARGRFTDANSRRTYVFADGHVEVRKDEE